MAKLGRNAPCHCGSGKKYKHCCGGITASTTEFRLSPEIQHSLNLEMNRHEAKEHRRRLMQGLGRPVISLESHGYRIVAIGKELRWSKRWLTFHDFLFSYIKDTLTPAWGNAELAKPEGDRHPLIHWYRKVCENQQANLASKKGEIYMGEMTGVMKAYLGLAYDLYLCAHNAELPPLLLKRLRNRDTFEGALYEAYVIGSFAKAGFTIEMEDEEDSTISHCEFVATHTSTGRKFSVEAKAVTSASKRAGATADLPKIRGKLYQALCKDVKYERIIFIELSRQQSILENGDPDWAKQIDQEIATAEKEITIKGNPAPPAYVFVTNRAFMHALDSIECIEAVLGCGFKIGDFPAGRAARSILEAVRARNRHIELYWLLKAMETHASIPSTFDDRTPEEAFSQDRIAPLQFGQTYRVPDESGDEVPGVLYDGVVMEHEQKVMGTFRLEDGRSIYCSIPITEAELASYKRSPDTFFGAIKHVSKRLKTPLDAFDFFFETYSNSTREKLLEFMSTWPNSDALQNLLQHDLAQIYSAQLATAFWMESTQRHTAG